MFGNATFSTGHLKGPYLPLTYTELAVRIRRSVIMSTVTSVVLVRMVRGLFIMLAFVPSGAKMAHSFYVMKMHAFRFLLFFLLSLSH